MGFGASKSTPLPKAEEVEPVPQEEDPAGLEAQRRARKAAAGREGYSGHVKSRPRAGSSTPSNQGAAGQTIQGKSRMMS